MRSNVSSFGEYVRPLPAGVRKKMSELRKIVKEEAPGAREKISYGMPAYSLNGVLLYFAAYAHHIGFYPAPSGIRAFKSKLSKYKHSKGAVQFPLEARLPVTLIREMVRFRVRENLTSARRAQRA